MKQTNMHQAATPNSDQHTLHVAQDHAHNSGVWHNLAWWEIALIALFICSVIWAALPAMANFTCKAQRSEARYLLSRLHAAQAWHLSQYQQLASLAALQQAIPMLAPSRFYSYELQQESTANSWYVVARGVSGAVRHDVWHINAAGRLQHMTAVCHGQRAFSLE